MKQQILDLKGDESSWPMTLEQAKEARVALMDERSAKVKVMNSKVHLQEVFHYVNIKIVSTLLFVSTIDK